MLLRHLLILRQRDTLRHVSSLHHWLLLLGLLLRLRQLLGLLLLLLLLLGHLLLLLLWLLWGLLRLLRQLKTTADDFDLNVTITFGASHRFRHALRPGSTALPQTAWGLDAISTTLHLLDGVDALGLAWDRHWHLGLSLLLLLLLLLLGIEELLLLNRLLLHYHSGHWVQFVLVRSGVRNAKQLISEYFALREELVVLHCQEFFA